MLRFLQVSALWWGNKNELLVRSEAGVHFPFRHLVRFAQNKTTTRFDSRRRFLFYHFLSLFLSRVSDQAIEGRERNLKPKGRFASPTPKSKRHQRFRRERSQNLCPPYAGLQFSAFVTTEIQNLTICGKLFQKSLDPCQVLLVQVHERIVQNQKRLVSTEHLIQQSQTEA